MKTSFALLSSLLLSLALASCAKKETPKLNMDEFADLYGRLLIVSESVQPTTDSLARLKQRKLDSLFTEYRTTEKEFRGMIGYYKEDPAVWAQILKKAAVQIDTLRSRIRMAETSR